MVLESQAPGASVAEVARRHGVNANLLFVWRRLEERGLLETRTRRGSGRRLVPVSLTPAPTVTAPGHVAGLRVRFTSGIELMVEGTPDPVVLERLITLLRC